MSTNEYGQPVGAPVPDWVGAKAPARLTLPGRHCQLAPLNAAAHGAALYAAFAEAADGRLWTYMPVGPFESEGELQRWAMRAQASEDPLFFTVLDHAQRPLGTTSYLRIQPDMGVIEVGHIAYAPALQRTRAATEAMYLMMAHAFDTLGYRRYEWKCDSLNAPSRAAAERLGFEYEGLFRQAVVYKGRNRDTAWYAITDVQWPKVKRGLERWLADGNFSSNGQQRRSLASLREGP